MPRHQFARPCTVKTNQYAVAALKDRRATLAGEIQQFKDGIRHREEALAHLDATLRILDPEYRAETIAPKKLRRVKLFGGGELNRLIIDALRRAEGKPLPVPQIADAIIAAKGYGHEAKPALGGNLGRAGGRMTREWRIWGWLALAYIVVLDAASWLLSSGSACIVNPERYADYYPGQNSCPTLDLFIFDCFYRFIELLGDKDWLIAISTAVTAAFTAILGISTIGLWQATNRLWKAGEDQQKATTRFWRSQLEQMRETNRANRQTAYAAGRSARIAEQSLFVGERPYVFVGQPRFNPQIGMDTFDFTPGAPSIYPEIIYPFENQGRTPALIKEVCAESLCVVSLPDVPEYRENRVYGELRYVLAAGQARDGVYVFKTELNARTMGEVSAGTAIGGGKNLYAFGYVKYEDIFGYVNTVGFCWRYQMAAKRFLPEENPSYNYRHAEPPQPGWDAI